MTSGPGDSRTFGGAPLFARPSEPARPTEGSRPPGSHDAESYVASAPARPTPPTAASPGSPTAATSTAARPMTVGTAAVTRKKGRRARLTVTRIDPWTTLKFSFVYSLAGVVVLLVAVIVLYGLVDALGVISSVRSFLGDVSDTSSGPGLGAWLGFGRVMLVTIIVGLVNVVLFTAFATLTAFIYNVCTDIVGGVEVTLAERN